MQRGRPAKCPYCDSHATRPKGWRQTATLGRRRIRKCRDCGRRFTLGRNALADPLALPEQAPAVPEAEDPGIAMGILEEE